MKFVLTQDLDFDSPSGASTIMGWVVQLERLAGLEDIRRPADRLAPDGSAGCPRAGVSSALVRGARRCAFARDAAAVANESLWQQRFVDSAADALSILATLGRNRDLVEFGRSMALWSAQPTTSGFNGFSGQMLLNQLVKRSEGHPELADVLIDVLRAPGDDGEARARLKRLVDYIEEIRVGSHPAPGHAPFLLSYFWALHDPEAWPILWSKSAAFVEFVSGQTLPTSPIDRYEEFLRQHRQLEDDVQRFANVSAWWHDEKPVLLDAVLVDRCQFGLDESNSVESRMANAGALVAVAQHIGTTLAEQVSSASGRSMQPMKPARTWRDDEPRADMWVDWRAHESGIGLRLWMNQNGVSIGLRPGWARNGWFDEVGPIAEAANLDGFRMLAAPWSKFGDDVGHVGGVRGEFAYARWFEPSELADLDVAEVVTDVAVALQPLIDQLVQRTGTESTASGRRPAAPDRRAVQATIADTLPIRNSAPTGSGSPRCSHRIGSH
jgi:5-methylcytosine-specific restriction enzyme B